VSSFFCFSGALHRISLERGVVKVCRHSGASRALCGQKPESILMFLRENRHPCLFSAPLPGARVTSLCLAKEKSPRESPPRCCVFVHPWTKNPIGPAGLADAPSMARRRVGAIPCAHPAGLIVRPSPQH